MTDLPDLRDNKRKAVACWCTAALVVTIMAANWAASTFGLVSIGMGLLIPAGTFFAALVFVLRDVIQQYGGRGFVAAAIGAGMVVSFAVALERGSPVPGISATRVAVASGAAFGLSELLDWWVYSRLRERSVVWAMLVSNTAGSALDTALFLSVSGFGLSWAAFGGQVLVKALVVSPIAVGVLWWLARSRTVPSWT
jgi:uncharacterized PurR-regulated membrane protein YhhQ (DUF165 family)